MPNDLRHAVRSLARTPSFTFVAVATIAIAIGATTAIFSVVHGILLEPLPYGDPSRLVIVWQTDAHNDSWRELASAPDYFDWKRETRSFSGLAANTFVQVNVRAGDRAERLVGAAITHDFMEVAGRRPLLGRDFDPEHDVAGAAPTVMISAEMWQEWFAGDPSVVGRTLSIDGVPHEILGVTPAAFGPRQRTDLVLPLAPRMGQFIDVRGMHNVAVWARLAPGVTVAEAQAEMTSIMQELERLHPEDNRGRGARVEPLHEAVVGDIRRPVMILFGAVALVLLIGCANVAGLLIARGVVRSREVSVRRALGAGRTRIAWGFLAEALTLGIAGGIAGVLLAWWGMRALQTILPRTIPRAANVEIDLAVLGFALAISIGSALLFGLLPALRFSRAGSDGLRSRSEGGPGAGSARRVLVAGEIALAVLLTIASGLMLRSFWNLLRVDAGFDPAGMITFDVSLPESRYPVPSRDVYPAWPEAVSFYERALEELRATPGVEQAALAMHHPMRRGWTSQVTIEGRPVPEGSRDEQYVRAVTPGYFAAARVPILRGRDFTSDDGSASTPVVIINDAFARTYFPGEDAVGKTLRFWGTPRTVVGVAGDVRFGGPREPSSPAIYPPLAQVPMSEIAVVVRARGNPLAHFAAIRGALARVDAELVPSNVRTLEELIGTSVGTERFQMLLITLFGATALFLAAIGVFGLVAYQVEQRRREIGIRMALGAEARGVVAMLVGESARLAAAGIAIGGAGAFAAMRLLDSFLFDVPPRDALTFAAVGALLLAIALLASWIPARRAAAIEPNQVLRYE